MEIEDTLRKLHLSSMANAYVKQLENPNIDLKSFDERFEEIISSEWDARYNKKLNLFIKRATLKYPSADFDETLYDSDRLLDVSTIEALNQLTWIKEPRNILITGATGAGKTYLACALCVTSLKKLYTVKFIKASSLIHELEKAELEKNYVEVLNVYSKYDVLALDDFGLMELDMNKCRNLFELIDSRDGQKPTIVISQFPVINWYDFFKDNTYADASMDRLIHKAYRIEMNGKNMRNPR